MKIILDEDDIMRAVLHYAAAKIGWKPQPDVLHVTIFWNSKNADVEVLPLEKTPSKK